MKIVGIIPARGGSKGVPRKNIRLLAGKPLVAYTIQAALNSKYIDKVIVSTEDSEIAEISKKFGSEVIERPQELAQDVTKTAPVIEQVVTELENQGYSPDIIVLLQPTCPLRDEKIIDAALEKLINSDNDSIFTGWPAGISMPLWKRKLDGSLESLYDYHLRPRRQEDHLREKMFCENGALYAIKRSAFEETKDFLGNKVDVFCMDPAKIPQIDIDTEEDFKKAEEIIIKYQKEQNS